MDNNYLIDFVKFIIQREIESKAQQSSKYNIADVY